MFGLFTAVASLLQRTGSRHVGLAAPRHVGSSLTRDGTCLSCTDRQFLNPGPLGESLHLFFFSDSFPWNMLFPKVFSMHLSPHSTFSERLSLWRKASQLTHTSWWWLLRPPAEWKASQLTPTKSQCFVYRSFSVTLKTVCKGPIFLHSREKVLLSTYCVLNCMLDYENIYKPARGMSTVKSFWKISRWSCPIHLALKLRLWSRKMLGSPAGCMITGQHIFCPYFHIILIKSSRIICVKYIVYSKWSTKQWSLLLAALLASYSTESLTH